MFRSVTESANVAIICLDQESRVVMWNRAAEMVFGDAASGAVGRPLVEWIRPESRGDFLAALSRARSRPESIGGGARFELVGQRADDYQVPLEMGLTAWHSGAKTYFTVTVHDITDRKLAREELARHRHRLEELVSARTAELTAEKDRAQRYLDVAGVILVALDSQGKITLINRKGCRTFGRSERFLVGRDWFDLAVPEPERSRARAIFDRMMADEVQPEDQYETRVINGGGEERLIVWHTALLKDEAGRVVGTLSSGEDITECKRTEEALVQEKLSREMVFDSISDSICLIDPDTYKITDVNQSFLREMNVDRGEVIGRTCHEVINDSPRPCQEMDRICALAEALATNSNATVRHTRQTGDGSSQYIEATVNLIRDENGRVGPAVHVSRNVTERKILEQQLSHAQKMEAVGRLAAGVAHDFNNILGVIATYSHLTMDTLDPDHQAWSDLEQINTAVQRASNLTRQLLAFSRRQVLDLKVVNLNDVVANIHKMIRRLIGEDIELDTSLDPLIGPIKVDPGQLEHVILNLAVNARDAMPDGGRLTLRTAEIDATEMEARGRPDLGHGRYSRLEVMDTGVGIEPTVLPEIFEPFFTTKARGKGTGLGLSTVYGIIKQSGGFIEVDSAPGRGTTFWIYLPVVDEEISATLPERDQEERQVGLETILVLEDEDAARQAAGRTLERYGYTVLEAGDAAEAEQVLASHPGQIHLLLTDVVLPGESGIDFARRLTDLRPGIKVLYMSGYAEDRIARYGLEGERINFVSKPFTVPTLTHKIREILDADE
jgi:PAS domain S-box-containing protein